MEQRHALGRSAALHGFGDGTDRAAQVGLAWLPNSLTFQLVLDLVAPPARLSKPHLQFLDAAGEASARQRAGLEGVEVALQGLLRLSDLCFDTAQLGVDAGDCRVGALPSAGERAADQIGVGVSSANAVSAREARVRCASSRVASGRSRTLPVMRSL